MGKRVTLQYFDQDGARRETVGVLERVDMTSGEPMLFIRKKDDTTVKVPLGKIRAGRVVGTAGS